MKNEKEQIKKLKDLLLEILVKNKDKYDQLLKCYKVQDLISRESQFFSNKLPLEKEDIANVCRLIIYQDLSEDDGFTIRKKDNVAYDFLARMALIMQNKLYDNYNLIDGKRRANSKLREVSLEGLEVPTELISNQFVNDCIEDSIVSYQYLEEFKKQLSRRERQVFILRFEEDYTQQKVGDELGITRSSVRVYLQRVFDKFKKFVA
ncbi:MAG: sigma-70 family RNA polymerase sigma factor [Bacillota bacterium]